jgi:hypothetical protein
MVRRIKRELKAMSFFMMHAGYTKSAGVAMILGRAISVRIKA